MSFLSQQKIRGRFPLEEQKKLAKNYYSLFRDELVNMAIEAFVEHSNGNELPKHFEKNPSGPKPLYKDDAFLVELKDLIKQGNTVAQMRKILGVSQPTISRAKNYLKERDSKEG